MSDKDVQRNVRSTSEEGIKTPAQKHENLSSHDNVSLGEHMREEAGIKRKTSIIDRFRKRELQWRQEKTGEKSGESEPDKD